MPIAFSVVRVCAFVVGCALLALGYEASLYGVPRAWVLAAVFVGGIGAMAALERYRGLAKVTRLPSVMEGAAEDDAR